MIRRNKKVRKERLDMNEEKTVPPEELEAGPSENALEEGSEETSGSEEVSDSEKAPDSEETPDAGKTPDSQAESSVLEGESAKYKEQYLRLAAEYDNYRKRTSREKTEAYGDAAAKTILEILPVLDNFERAMAAETTDEKFKSGMEMIQNQLIGILDKLGVKEIEAKDQPFDPNLHHAVQQIEDEELGENVVAQVFQRGYRLGDRVLRAAMVVVANP